MPFKSADDEILGFVHHRVSLANFILLVIISHLCGFILNFRHVTLGAEDGDDVPGRTRTLSMPHSGEVLDTQYGEEQSSHSNPWRPHTQLHH